MKIAVHRLAFLSVFLLVFSVGAAHALDYDYWEASVVTAADALLTAQNDDGSFDWVNDGDPAVGGAPNTQGATGRGLVAAYNVTGDARYLEAANDTAAWLTTNSTGLYNKDIEFLFELQKAGGADHTAWARNQAVSYINGKITEQGGTGAEAVRSSYLESTWTADSGVMNGTKLWMIGEWGHVAQLLGDTEIYAGYAGSDMAEEMGTLLINDFGSFDYANDDYGTLGLVGILEATAAGGKGTYGPGETEALLALSGRTTTGWQDTGYATYTLALYGMGDATQLSTWITEGHFDTGIDANLESRGEALLGVASAAPVPEPATILLLGAGLVGVAGLRRRRQG